MSKQVEQVSGEIGQRHGKAASSVGAFRVASRARFAASLWLR
ncbi:hypothetical protein [Sphingomonas sp. G-3-2-10]|nr:hypothetical protein [Sphingomonas sp. G-3-2-10]